MADIETEIGNTVPLYGNVITRGCSNATISPSQTPVVWVPDVLPNVPAVGGQPLDFSADTLGAHIPSHDDTTGTPKYTGLVRGVFEMRVKSGAGNNGTQSLEPGAPASYSHLWLLLLKKVDVPAQGVLCVGSTVSG